jgi:hypothetical protein
MRVVVALGSLAMGAAGFVVLWERLGWMVALAVFLILFSENISRSL